MAISITKAVTARPVPFAKMNAKLQRALGNSGISTLQQLATFTEKDVLKLHGMGPGSLPKLRELLKQQDLSFKTK